MRIAHGIVVAALVVGGVFASTAFTQDKPEELTGMKRWMDSCKPGPHHKELARFIGSWDTEMSMIGMGAAPVKSKGTIEFKWLVEGKWITSESHGSMMGMPVTAYATMGYDNFRKHFVWTGVDSFTTAMLHSEGNFDQSGKALIAYGTMDEPMDGENDKPVKHVWRFDGSDKITLEVHDLAIGETNTKVIEWVYTRRK